MRIYKKLSIVFLGIVFLLPQVLEAQSLVSTSTEPAVCCSSVIFLPGIQASRLASSSDHLWEPFGNGDVKRLYINKANVRDPFGAVKATEIVGSAYGIVPIYRKFIAMMDSMVADGVIKNWVPFAYDWRRAAMDIGEAEGVLMKKVEEVARTSKTGKVIIIAHSNGGLVVKELLRQLQNGRKGHLVEKAVLVAVPELGTPQTIFSMIHGDGQEIAWGRILSKATARTFSQILPSAFMLLPGQSFFSKSKNPVIVDNEESISTYSRMKTFLRENPWSVASSSDTDIPVLLANGLLGVSESFHLILDLWKPASTTKVTSIAGWGVETPETLVYTRTPHCTATSSCSIERKLKSTVQGDGTVLTTSHMPQNKDTSLFFNMKNFIRDTRQRISHANILEAEPLLEVVKEEVLTGATSSQNHGKYFSTEEPVYKGKDMLLSFHSPVDVDIYTPDGRHTGIIPSPVAGLEFPWLENELGAFVEGFGSPDDTKQVSLPYGPDYQFVIRGNNAGALIVEVEIQEDEIYDVASTTFLEIPITPLTQIDLQISSSSDTLHAGSLMYIDVDGDSVTDFIQRTAEALQASPHGVVGDFALYVEAMRKTILALKLSSDQEKFWIQRLDKILLDAEKKHPRKAEKMVKKLTGKKFRGGELTSEQETVILKVFEKLALRLETGNFTDIDR